MENLFNGAYKGKKVLVTGHTCFKGSWLVAWLDKMGAEVAGYALAPNTNPCHFEVLNLNIESHINDIRDLDVLKKAIHDFQPEIIFHLAAQPLVGYSYENPIETYSTNVMGSLNILESAKGLDSLKAIVSITTDKVYENKEKEEGYKEDERLGGYDPYSSSKACVEIMTDSIRNSFFHIDKYGTDHQVLIATVRAGNVIGGGDWADMRLIPDIARATSKGEKVLIRNPYSVRPWQHVLEPLSGYLMIGQKLLEKNIAFSGAWNFGPEEKVLVNNEKLVEIAKKSWDRIDPEFGAREEWFHETKILMLDSLKAIEDLNWRPVWTYDEAIEVTIEWYKNYHENNRIDTSADIDNYVETARIKNISWTNEI